MLPYLYIIFYFWRYIMQIQTLLNSLESTIYEGILKLDGCADSSMSIYYDLDLINYLLSTSFSSNEECFHQIASSFKKLGKENQILVTLQNNRFQFTVTKDGISHICKSYENKPFLKELIALTKNRNFTLEQVETLFSTYSSNYIHKTFNHPEFQHIFSFLDTSLDPYIYCFSFDEMGSYFHRLLPYHFEELIKESHSH